MLKLNVDNSDTLRLLRRSHEKLFPPSKSVNGTDRSLEYEMEAGSCFAWHQYADPSGEFAVDKWFNSKGSKFPSHAHDETECIVVTSGQMLLKYSDGEELLLKSGGSVCNRPGREHWAFFPEDTHYYTVMVPAASDYPQADAD